MTLCHHDVDQMPSKGQCKDPSAPFPIFRIDSPEVQASHRSRLWVEEGLTDWQRDFPPGAQLSHCPHLHLIASGATSVTSPQSSLISCPIHTLHPAPWSSLPTSTLSQLRRCFMPGNVKERVHQLPSMTTAASSWTSVSLLPPLEGSLPRSSQGCFLLVLPGMRAP